MLAYFLLFNSSVILVYKNFKLTFNVSLSLPQNDSNIQSRHKIYNNYVRTPPPMNQFSMKLYLRLNINFDEALDDIYQ